MESATRIEVLSGGRQSTGRAIDLPIAPPVGVTPPPVAVTKPASQLLAPPLPGERKWPSTKVFTSRVSAFAVLLSLLVIGVAASHVTTIQHGKTAFLGSRPASSATFRDVQADTALASSQQAAEETPLASNLASDRPLLSPPHVPADQGTSSRTQAASQTTDDTPASDVEIVASADRSDDSNQEGNAQDTSVASVVPTVPQQTDLADSLQLPAAAPQTTCRSLGTALEWTSSPEAAFQLAKQAGKLVFLIQVSGNFAREEFT